MNEFLFNLKGFFLHWINMVQTSEEFHRVLKFILLAVGFLAVFAAVVFVFFLIGAWLVTNGQHGLAFAILIFGMIFGFMVAASFVEAALSYQWKKK